MNLRYQQVESLDCLGQILLDLRLLRGLLVRRSLVRRSLAREGTCLPIGYLSTTTGSCFAGELFRLEGWASGVGEVSKLIAEFLSLQLEGAECVFSVLPEFCICMPGSHVEQQIENGRVVRRK